MATVPYLVSANLTELDKFRQVYLSARGSSRTRAVRRLDFRDSRGSYGGFGQWALPMECFRLWKRYGNTPETPLCPLISWGTGSARGDGTGQWCMGSQCASSTHSLTSLSTANTIPWYMEGVGRRLQKNNDGVNATSVFTLQHKADTVSPSTAYIPAGTYFQTSGVRAEIFLARQPSTQADIKATLGRDPGATVTFFPTLISNAAIDTASATSVQGNVSSCNGVEGPVRSYLTASFGDIGTDYAHLVLGSNSTTVGTEHVGCLFRSANTSGIAVSSWSTGGKKAADLAAEIVNWYNTINAYRPDLIRLSFGYNDANAGKTPSQYQADMQSSVDLIRANCLGPDAVNPPLIEINSPYNQAAIAGTNFDLYPGACANIALGTKGVLARNQRRVSDEMGFAPAVHESDNIHATAAGSDLNANADDALDGMVIGPESVANWRLDNANWRNLR